MKFVKTKFVLAAVAAIITFATVHNASAAPALAERRAVEEFKTKKFEDYKKKINEAAGTSLDVTVDWDSLALEGESANYDNYFSVVIFDPIVNGLKGVTTDQMGKDALKAKLKKIVIKNTGEYHGPDGYTFSGDTLTVDQRPNTNVDDTTTRADAIKTLLEKNL